MDGQIATINQLQRMQTSDACKEQHHVKLKVVYAMPHACLYQHGAHVLNSGRSSVRCHAIYVSMTMSVG